jgi:hypothetical protein
MKKIIFIFLVATIATSCYTAKTVTLSDAPFVKVYDDITGTQDELFLKANEWMISTFKDAKSVIQHSDKEEGVILGKYLMTTTPNVMAFGASTATPGTDVFAVIDIRVKPNKARIEIKPYDFTYVSDGMGKEFSKEDATLIMEVLAESLHQILQTKKVDF